ncbi:hypothetical protein BN1708_004612, partial [Verticillium longisporum]
MSIVQGLLNGPAVRAAARYSILFVQEQKLVPRRELRAECGTCKADAASGCLVAVRIREDHDNLVCSGPVPELSTGLCKKEAVLHVHAQRVYSLADTWPTRQIQSDATMRRASLIHRDQERTKYAPSHETHTVNNSVDEPRQIDAVKERHQPRIEPRIAMHLVIVPSEIVDVARPPILGPLLLLAHDPGVLVAVVGDDAPAQDIVGDDEAAGAQQPRAAAGRRPGEDGVEV